MRESPLPHLVGKKITAAKLLLVDYLKQYQLALTFEDGSVLNLTIAAEAVGQLLR